MKRQVQSLVRLRELVGELFDARYGGADAIRITRAQALADGYMKALCDLGVAKERELIALIEAEQRRVSEQADACFSARLTGIEAAPNMA